MGIRYGLLFVCLLLSLTGYGSLLVVSAAPAETRSEGDQQPPPWSYEGATGPAHWGSLSPEYATCADGTEQSPIDIIRSKVKPDDTAANVTINYKPTLFTLQNTGHTIQANDAFGGNTVVLDGEPYKLVQLHFHRPGEHQLNGKNFAMEGHLVHQNQAGQLAVVGFFIKPGKENMQLADMWSRLPRKMTNSDIPLLKPVDLAALLPADRKSFRYNGSLTTPPCSEGVKWVMLEQPVEMSKQQIAAFTAIFPDNHRPVQPLNDRQVVN